MPETHENRKPLNLRKLIKPLLIIDIALACVFVVVQLTITDAAAQAVDYTGIGKVLAMIGIAIISFIIGLFIALAANIVFIGGALVLMLAWAFLRNRNATTTS